MSTRDIVATFKEMYDADVSATLISKVTDVVLDRGCMVCCADQKAKRPDF